MESNPPFRFLTSHYQHNSGQIVLQFWTYSFTNHDLFLDKSISFDSALTMVHSCPLTKYLYIQRAAEPKELIIVDAFAGDVLDKIDQAEDFQGGKVIGYREDIVIFYT